MTLSSIYIYIQQQVISCQWTKSLPCYRWAHWKGQWCRSYLIRDDGTILLLQARNCFSPWTWSQYPPSPTKSASRTCQAEKGLLVLVVAMLTDNMPTFTTMLWLLSITDMYEHASK
ncbi:unnamed protein product [Caretta caretta]